jgi:methylmalonyl-CoA mutase N-terminal domain/subunit
VSDDRQRLEAEKKRWEDESLKPARRQLPERRESFVTHSRIPVEPLYTALDVPGDYLTRLGFPGEYPFTRGVQPTMYRGRFWTMRQYAGFGDARASNERYRYLLSQGQTGLSVAFDLPTQMGFDSDHPSSRGEVGKVGVAISSLEDMEVLLAGIPLGAVSTSMTINATAAILLCLYIAVAERQGVPAKVLRGTIQNDVLKEYVARGTYIYPPGASMRIITDIFAFCKGEVPRWNTISVSGYHIREAGATAAQEIAFTLADGIAYVEAARKAGLSVDDFASRISFFFNAHNNLLEEVAKFRVARALWAEIMRERFGARDPRSWMLRFHAQTAGSMLTAQQPLNNVVRTALQALAAVLGGAQSIHTNSFDEALGLPTEEAATVALRTQQVIAHESGVADFVDPLGGSYALEAVGEGLMREARRLLTEIDTMGGAVRAIEVGFMQREILDAAYRWQREVDSGSRVVVGVNEYAQGEAAGPQVLRIGEELERDQIERLRALRARRDASAVRAALGAVGAAARSGENLLPRILQAVRAYATVGEVSDELRAVFGTHREILVV